VDFPKSTFNRALFAQRQPGSAIKPLIYAAALDLGITASSRWDDTPATYARGYGRAWTPRNYGDRSTGTPTLREALAHSSNVVTVKLLDTIGVPHFVDFARKLGLTLRTPNDLSLALGTGEVTLHDLMLTYTPFATGGLRPESRTIIRIYERSRMAWAENPPAVTPVLEPATAYVTTRMLQDVMAFGTAKSLSKFAQERPAAGKTGTTDDYRDAWFIGYTPQMITGVWVGHDTPKPGGKGFTGGAVAAPIWERFMRQALAGEPPVDFTQPETVVAAAIDPLTGYLATAECPQSRDEFYILGSEPTAYCPEHSSTPPEPATAEPPPAEGTELLGNTRSPAVPWFPPDKTDLPTGPGFDLKR